MIEQISSDISYSEFYERFIKANKPCLFDSCFTKTWNSRKDWVKQDGTVNVEFFKKHFGDIDAPVVDCNKKHFSSHEKCDMKVNDFFSYWNNRVDKVLYLKDWHLQQNNSGFYEVPMYFTSDWLNEYFDYLNADDYRFVYIGVKGTWTPFHADVFRSFSWSANICGLKKWIFYPPGEEELLKDNFGKLPYNVTDALNHETNKGIEVFQKAGEVIFVPSGWHHQVFNMEDTISINHNWINATNIRNMFDHLCVELEKVKKEIRDCRSMDGFEQHCQLILHSAAGIDFNGFFDMVIFLLQKRIGIAKSFQNASTSTSDSTTKLFSKMYITASPNVPNNNNCIPLTDQIKYLHYDLSQLQSVLESLLSNIDFQTVALQQTISKGQEFLNRVNSLKQ